MTDVEAAAEQFREMSGWSMSEGDAIASAFIAGAEWREHVLDAATSWEYGIRAGGDDEPYSDISEDLDYLLDGALATSDEQAVRRIKAGPWEPLPIQQNRVEEAPK